MVTTEQLQLVKTGDLATLAELDRQGLIMGAQESLEDYAARLECLRKNIEQMDSSLADSGRFEVEGLSLEAGGRIDPEQFSEAREITEPKYSFFIDWVPGFYINPRFGWLFGGCAFYFCPDFFSIFILRRAFASRRKWLIYDRRELLAHELCHVARIALMSGAYEEQFAYRVSGSRFRRIVGGMFRSPVDSFALLGSTFLLLGMQILRLMAWPWIPMWPFWSLIALLVCGLLVRGTRSEKQLRRAESSLASFTDAPASAILFRCTDSEINQLAAADNPSTVAKLLDAWRGTIPRWQVIGYRFLRHDGAG